MSTIRKIRRNSKEYANARETAMSCRVYSLSNYFHGEDCNELALVRYMTKEGMMGQCALHESDGTYTLRVHSNLWFTFQVSSSSCRPQLHGRTSR